MVVRKPENIQKIWESTAGIYDITPQYFIKKAPVMIVVCTDTNTYRGHQARIHSELYCIQDSAAATMNLLLAACDRGLGACWVDMFKEEKRRIFEPTGTCKTGRDHTDRPHELQRKIPPKKNLEKAGELRDFQQLESNAPFVSLHKEPF